MLRATPTFALVLALASAAGRSGAQTGPSLPNPIANPGAPWAYAGFVVNAPTELGWQSAYKTVRGSAVGRKAAGSDHTYAVTVNTLPLDRDFKDAQELATYLLANRGNQTDLRRFEIVSHTETAVSHAGAPCSEYRLNAKDKGVAPDTALALVMQGVTCVHPDKSDWVVDVGYSERGGDARLGDELLAVGKRSVESLRFFPAVERPAIKEAYVVLKSGDLDRVKQLLVPLADGGDRFVALRLGEMLLKSNNSDDLKLARKYLEMAAADGHVDALYNLGSVYDQGLGVPRDIATAVRWFTFAADQRDAQAQLNLGILHHPRGNGNVKDINIADHWLRMSADNGNDKARQLVGGR